MACFLFRVTEVSYDEEDITACYIINKWMTLPELYTLSWHEINYEKYAELYNKTQAILNENNDD